MAFLGIPGELVLPLGITMVVIVVVVLWIVSRKPLARVLYRVDSGSASLRLFPARDLEVSLRAFRLEPGRKSWGFDAAVRSASDLDRLVLSFDGSRIVFAGIEAEKLAIKPVELKLAKKIGKMRFSVSTVPELELTEIVVPLNEVLTELRRVNGVSLISEAKAGRSIDKARVREELARQFEEMLEARKTPGVSSFRERLEELGEEQKQAQLSYLKRELSEATFRDLLDKIEEERIQIKAKMARAQKRLGGSQG